MANFPLGDLNSFQPDAGLPAGGRLAGAGAEGRGWALPLGAKLNVPLMERAIQAKAQMAFRAEREEKFIIISQKGLRRVSIDDVVLL
jgi:hypothetical protein